MSPSLNCSGLSAFPQHVSEFMGPAKSERHSTRSASSTVSRRSSTLPLPVRRPTLQFLLRQSPLRKARTRIRQQLQHRNLTPFQSVELQLKLKPLLEEQATARMLAGNLSPASAAIRRRRRSRSSARTASASGVTAAKTSTASHSNVVAVVPCVQAYSFITHARRGNAATRALLKTSRADKCNSSG